MRTSARHLTAVRSTPRARPDSVALKDLEAGRDRAPGPGSVRKPSSRPSVLGRRVTRGRHAGAAVVRVALSAASRIFFAKRSERAAVRAGAAPARGWTPRMHLPAIWPPR